MNIKYLIKSNYFDFDEWDLSNVCICDTKEKAEELIKEFNDNKNKFKSINGFIIHLERDFFNDSIFSNFDEKYILDDGYKEIKVFIKKDDFIQYQESLDELDIYYQENTFFEFLTFFNNKNDLLKKYCNHEDAKLYIEEIEEY